MSENQNTNTANISVLHHKLNEKTAQTSRRIYHTPVSNYESSACVCVDCVLILTLHVKDIYGVSEPLNFEFLKRAAVKHSHVCVPEDAHVPKVYL